MIIPVRCFTCGKVIASLYEDYKKSSREEYLDLNSPDVIVLCRKCHFHAGQGQVLCARARIGVVLTIPHLGIKVRSGMISSLTTRKKKQSIVLYGKLS